MKTLRRILLGLLVVVLLLVVVAFFLPRTYRVERSIVIHAKPEVVYPQFGDLRNWKNWGAWQERDPAMKIETSAQTTGVGAWSRWESRTEGNGKMTFTAVEEGTRVAYLLEFPDMGTRSNGLMLLQPEGTGVKVIWVDAGDLGLNPLYRWFGLFLEKMIGPDFEKGLANLKRQVEASSK